uniref:Uncharacterized protein n=1 Tax=Oryza glumipatula TaxID=40148 RepID=A0A0D9YJZ7_9ORYZ
MLGSDAPFLFLTNGKDEWRSMQPSKPGKMGLGVLLVGPNGGPNKTVAFSIVSSWWWMAGAGIDRVTA